MTSPGRVGARIAYLNIVTPEPERLAGFYMTLFGFSEILAHRSPIYRCLDAGGLELGFNAEAAYDLLALADRKPSGPSPVRTFITVEVESADLVDHLCSQAKMLGGHVVKPPYLTYYNARQAVLTDPDGNVFRLNHRLGPRVPARDVADPPW